MKVGKQSINVQCEERAAKRKKEKKGEEERRGREARGLPGELKYSLSFYAQAGEGQTTLSDGGASEQRNVARVHLRVTECPPPPRGKVDRSESETASPELLADRI